MRRNQTSMTAQGIAIMRAVESSRPEGERILYDPYARGMVPGWFYHFTRFFIDSGYAELRGPGVMGYLVARDRYIDDFLLERLAEGIQQLVLLGAGYDARAYRFKDRLQGVKVFEVDHPATQQDKLERLKRIFGQVPESVTFVPVDFNTQSLEQRLLASGYDPSVKNVFLWQGVTMYLDAAAMDRTLKFIASCSAPGSALVFDYVYPATLQGAAGHGEVSGMRRYRGMTGEGLTFGIPQGQVEEYLLLRGFERAVDIDSQALKPLYFTGKNSRRRVVPGYAIVYAFVSP